MKYIYFILAGLIALAGLYSLSGIAFFKWQYHQSSHPKASFQIIESEKSTITIVDFVTYRCGFCKNMHPIIKEALKLNKNIRYIPRPIPIQLSAEQEKQQPNDLVSLALAAGLQGKFYEMHEAFLEYPDDIIPENVIQETANLYGVDYNKMVEDSKTKKIQIYIEDNINDMLGMNIQTIPSYIIGKNIYVIGTKLPDLKDFLIMIMNEEKNNE